MNSKISLLMGVLAVQFVLVALFWFAGAPQQTADRFVQVVAADVRAMSISSGGDESVELAREDDGWVVGGVKADDAKIADVLDKVGGLDASWPVATSGSSAERFEVTDDNFQRRVRLSGEGGKMLAEFYLGTSPGYQRVHARVAGGSDIFSVGLSNYEFGVKVDDWMDKGLLATATEPQKIQLTNDNAVVSTLRHGEEGWLIDDVAADQDEAQTYANRFKTLRVLGVAAGEQRDAAHHVATLSITDDTGEFEMTFARKDEESTDYVVESTRVDGTYRLATYLAEQLLMTDADFLPEEEVSDAGTDHEGSG